MSDIDAGRKILARFSRVNVALSVGAILAFASFITWRSPVPFPQISSRSVGLGLVVLLIAALALSGPIVGVWRLLAGDGAAVWVEGGRLHWSPWGSISLDDLTGVRPAHYVRGGWSQIILDRRSSFLSPTIHTTLYDISRDALIRAIETLKPGLAYPDEPV